MHRHGLERIKKRLKPIISQFIFIINSLMSLWNYNTKYIIVISHNYTNIINVRYYIVIVIVKLLDSYICICGIYCKITHLNELLC